MIRKTLIPIFPEYIFSITKYSEKTITGKNKDKWENLKVKETFLLQDRKDIFKSY